MPSATPSLTSVQRAFDVIRLLWETNGAGPSEIASRMEIPKSTAHVYLRTLESTGYVVNRGGEYSLSYKFLSTGSRIKYRSRIYQVSKLELKRLTEATGELVTLVIEEAGRSVILHEEFEDQSLELGIYPGMTFPSHAHAPGKTILAHMSEERLEEVLETRGLPQVTEQTITDRETLLAELADIREQGYAVDWDQQVDGMGLLAVPIVVEGTLKACLGIAVPTGRLKNESYQRTLLREAEESADTIRIKYRYGQ
ncbi:ArcR family transcriptional regulator [Halostagnicola sp. A56]|uniref:IclR family transcriptional regulator n=1 Tax=Halostagnicola sp. A56 TaxID=1495067 RepID=UPI00049F38F8|nr:IclR family transcriptional regulator [Halostagnicola sp. A56]KDE57282.1 ArcR family transcriptional regulator [Halostagnicola sp. A56]